jgi:hypothetical protein
MLSNFKSQLKTRGEVYLRVKVKINAQASAIKEIIKDDEDEETIKIDIAAQPIQGRANEELIKLLAREFGVSKNTIKIINGQGSRLKLVKIVIK